MLILRAESRDGTMQTMVRLPPRHRYTQADFENIQLTLKPAGGISDHRDRRRESSRCWREDRRGVRASGFDGGTTDADGKRRSDCRQGSHLICGGAEG